VRALAAAALLAGVVPQALVATPADETSPSGAGGYLAWTVGSQNAPVIVMKLGRVWLRHAGRSVPVTPPGVPAASGGMDGRTLVVQLVRHGNSDLALFDLRTRQVRDAPVNTSAWEWRGSISGRWLLFGRADFGAQRYDVVLADLRTGRERVLDSVRGHGAYAEPGQVDGRWAAWAVCPDNVCAIVRYDLRTGARVRIPSPYHGVLYAPSVASNGDVYFGRGAGPCGSEVSIRRYRAGRITTVAKLATGYDLRFSGVDGRRLLLDGGRCRGSYDVLQIPIGRAKP
jgi:hypothetical protein